MIFKVTWTIEDWKRKKGYVVAWVDEPNDPDNGDAIDFRDIELWAQYQALNLDIFTKGKVTNIAVTCNVALPADLKTLAHANADVEEGATVTYRGYDSAEKVFQHRIPTASEEYVDQDRVWHWEQVPVGETEAILDVQDTFFRAMGWGLADIERFLLEPCNERGDIIAYPLKAVENFKK